MLLDGALWSLWALHRPSTPWGRALTLTEQVALGPVSGALLGAPRPRGSCRAWRLPCPTRKEPCAVVVTPRFSLDSSSTSSTYSSTSTPLRHHSRGFTPLMRRAGSSIVPARFMLRARLTQNRAYRVDLRIHSPPADARIERPTPWLLVQGELQTSASWNQAVRYLTAKGCTVATLEHRQDLSKASLADLEGEMMEAVHRLAAMAPVIVAHSFMGFVAQKFLESHAASGLILVNAFPPLPAQCIQRYVPLLGMSIGPEGSIDGPLDPGLVKLLYGEGIESDKLDMTFPRKAMEEACMPQSVVRLEPHSVPMVVLGCEHDRVVTKEEVHATAEFHGVEPQDVHLFSWRSHALPREKVAQQQLIDRMYEWYDANY